MLNPHPINNAVVAVIVIYHPDAASLRALIDAIGPQVQAVVVIDNGSSDVIKAALQGMVQGLRLIHLEQHGNQGLSQGLNSGIRHALDIDASHVILFDQDSLPGPAFVAGLLAAERDLLARGIKLAALGPVTTDIKSGEAAPIMGFERLYTRKKYRPDFDDYIEAGYLITSGQLIRRAMLEQVGLMRADLFIDGIDIEWCLRARGRGLRSFAVANVAMSHNLGDQTLQIAGLTKPLHGPLRHYYIIRNAFLLCRSKELPFGWKVAESLKTLRRLLAYAIFCENPRQHILWMARGLRDGLMGRAGEARYPHHVRRDL